MDNVKTFEQLYREHSGKVSDKWSLYLPEYASLFAPLRDKQVRLLEIGTQNGGSLEVYAKYFHNAKKLLGCDIDPKCADLRYDDPRIAIVTGDATSDACEQHIADHCSTLDIIIDDGSHKTSDIVRAFAKYFARLNDDGIYIIEDLHASYWTDWEGGLYDPCSAMAFFKRLADVLNHEHWRLDKSRTQFLEQYAKHLDITFDECTLSSIHSITFTNSLCGIRKRPHGENILGERVVVGREASVKPQILKKSATTVLDDPINAVGDDHIDVFALMAENDQLKGELDRHQQAADKVEQQLSEQRSQIEALEAAEATWADETSRRDSQISSLRAELNQERQIRTSIERNYSETVARLGEWEKKSNSTRWLTRSIGRKLTHTPRDASRRIRRSWKKRQSVQTSLYAGLQIKLNRLSDSRFRKYTFSKILLLCTPLLSKSFAQRIHKRMVKNSLIKSEGIINRPYQNIEIINLSRLKVSAIIPNYNHDSFLSQRIDSLLSQTITPNEIIILDDASTDHSRDVIDTYVNKSHVPIRVLYNTVNSGNVFKQWEKGIANAKHDLIWICESDDFCDREFLSRLIPYFSDPSVMIAFGKIQFANSEGVAIDGLDAYRESAQANYWDTPKIEGTYKWFHGPLGKRNVIANASGCLLRRQHIEDAIWSEVQTYKVCGDWYLYMILGRGGQIAYDPGAVSYFRQHEKNTSVLSSKDLQYYHEHFRIALELRKRFGASPSTIFQMGSHLEGHFNYSFPGKELNECIQIFDKNKILETNQSAIHIVFGVLGFKTGGGEIFPIHLANAFVKRGYIVSFVILEKFIDNPIREMLDNRIAIYTKKYVEDVGLKHFLKNIGATIIHTHFVGFDQWMLHICKDKIDIPYVVTHHGSYEVTELDYNTKRRIISRVDKWIYIADKNLSAFNEFSFNDNTWIKLPNAVPTKQLTSSFNRDDLGIERDAFVFGVATRAIKEKGWDTAVQALITLMDRINQPVYILFCGDGDDFDELHDNYKTIEQVKFLGYQEDIVGFYKICDCCLLPTRFQGESFPLTLIEGMLARLPCIATDIGEIRNMITDGNRSAGILVPFQEDAAQAVTALANAMEEVLDPIRYKTLNESVNIISQKFCFEELVNRYDVVYKDTLSNFES